LALVIRGEDGKAVECPSLFHYEKIGMAVSKDMIHWIRYGQEHVIANGEEKQHGISGDPRIVQIGDVWAMF
jgi:predicted GH43/DUF377 family glycosyl hydrolase